MTIPTSIPLPIFPPTPPETPLNTPPLSPVSTPASSPTKLQSPSGLKTWKVTQSPGGTINPYPPKKIRMELIEKGISGNVIYRWKHEVSGRRYIGSSLKTEIKGKNGNTIFKRLGKYKFDLNNPKKMRRPHIINAIRRSPTKFSIKIMDCQPQIEERALLALEEDYQDQYSTRERKNGYNHSRPTLERSRAKKTLFQEDEDLVSPTRSPSERKAALVAKEKLISLDY